MRTHTHVRKGFPETFCSSVTVTGFFLDSGQHWTVDSKDLSRVHVGARTREFFPKSTVLYCPVSTSLLVTDDGVTLIF